jgi:hypothetical protein
VGSFERIIVLMKQALSQTFRESIVLPDVGEISDAYVSLSLKATKF